MKDTFVSRHQSDYDFFVHRRTVFSESTFLRPHRMPCHVASDKLGRVSSTSMEASSLSLRQMQKQITHSFRTSQRRSSQKNKRLGEVSLTRVLSLGLKYLTAVSA